MQWWWWEVHVMCSGDGESLCSCGILVVGGYVCSGDSVRCSIVVVGGYGCSGDSECHRGGGEWNSNDVRQRCSMVIVRRYVWGCVCSGIVSVYGGCVCSGDSECLWRVWRSNTVMVCVMCNGDDGKTIEKMNGLTWFNLFQRVRIGESSAVQVSRSNFPSTSPILVTTFSWEMTWELTVRWLERSMLAGRPKNEGWSVSESELMTDL